jgi:HK97 family phage portal protein
LEDVKGLSPLLAARTPIDRHNLAEEWNSSLIRNFAKPPGMFSLKAGKDMPANLTPDQRQALKEQLEEWVGPSQGTKPFVGEGGLIWQQMGLSPVDMDWSEAKVSAARDVGNALGYPPFLYGIPGDNTYSNQREARLALWENTIVPLVLMLASELSEWLNPRFTKTAGATVTIQPDFDNIAALSLKMERIWDRVGKADWITPNERRAATGYEPDENEEADLLYIDATKVPLALSLEPKDLPAPPPGKERRKGNGAWLLA